MKRLALLGAMAALAALAGTLLFAGGAGAHERREVGPYTFVVGWLNEPALLNQPNSVDLRITHTADGTPVTGAERTLKVEISAEGDAKKLNADFTPRFNTPGAYNAPLTPTTTGAFTFLFTGVLEGVTINETFKAGQGTFGLIEQPRAFPRALPAVQDVAQQVAALQEGSSSSGDSGSSGDTALYVAIAALLVAAAGLGAGVMALTRRSG